jgi:hypothetical protein
MYCPECGTRIFNYFPRGKWENTYSDMVAYTNEDKATYFVEKWGLNGTKPTYHWILLETIDEIVNRDERPYKEKLQEILAECDNARPTNMNEFLSWFDGIEW